MIVFLAATVACPTVMLCSVPLAHADGLSSCKEDPDTLNAEAKKTIEIISEKVPLGQYETPSTVLQFVNKSLNGVGIKMQCSEIMAYYADGPDGRQHQCAEWTWA
jgi:hypothetical protein